MHQLLRMYHSKELHHAYYFVEHKAGELVSKLKHFLENVVGIKTVGNPDFYHGKFETLTIDDARTITELSGRKSFNYLEARLPSRRIYIIEADFVTEEAQNSLLKVFEEPTSGTHFFIISPQEILLPTLRSRMMVIEGESQKSVKEENILRLPLNERLAKVKEITEGISNEEKTKQDAIILLNQVEVELYEKGVEKSSGALKVCESARASLYDRGAPIKMILENLMLSI
ncbi:MAG: hypothetical protein A3H52_00750 [Candidatus Zambryskibacteria bacterium RIFCSPLOWO2_02_FULL_39_26]|uniref:DNA polymerase III subunit delta n=1 Tax=Candidatus Zambryskibacteria bacterium RIFCSPLOWO2_12_FULL_39_23 TaxID=1802776 RepID=A0A1G2UT75_9BACT|nr:MAG: hypothetical protein A2W51_00580 [Candidatus Zambryskibacteria bacterium RIFCSPHIGHO2_02_39_10]OHA99843.1 MAG: hypothetical protein A3E59_02280 [Candidatus Zambryskibacteria bacterium RIFCSPHIGHO2_12_FULL_39_47]OHB10248.1 MAG: hypothetical protein A3H52_00750 [Candidatus Zambryskibacteria bacterium RIFCSPLOWO2_02_FULL_39_26]OHB12587.1 MAG: hypothetical protein A3G99_02085 [Candidatus Zambryskibacteria bacterium RIFCSPLOWO2_12_FULL_39_23]